MSEAEGTVTDMSATTADLVTIDDLTSEGSGVGRLEDGRAVFVPRTVPGEKVRISVTDSRKSFAKAELVAVVEASEDRREAPCPLYDRCGGCQIQHIGYAAQVAGKASRIEAALRRIGGLEIGPVEVEPAEAEYGYRNRVTFTLRRLRGGRVVAGFHHRERAGHVIEVRYECLLPEAAVGRAWVSLRENWDTGASRLPAGGMLRLTLRAAGTNILLVIEGGRVGNDDVKHARELVSRVPGLCAVWHRPEGEDEPMLLAGDRTVADRWFGEELQLQSSAFLQVNRAGAEALHTSVLKEMGSPTGRRIVDAYCGVGGYGRRLAHHGAEVVGIESDPAAVRVALTDAHERFTVIQGQVEHHLEALLAPGGGEDEGGDEGERGTRRGIDRVILNPPRAGVDERVTELLRTHPVERVVYVSCDPATLARDLSRLGDAYRIRRVRGFDLFPQTSHVETVVTLDAIAADTPDSPSPTD